MWKVCFPLLLLFFVAVVVGPKVMPETGADPRQAQAAPAPQVQAQQSAPAVPPMPEMTVADYKAQPPEQGAWLPGVLGRLNGRDGGDYKVFVRDAKGVGGVIARVSPDTEEGRQVHEILKDGNQRLITFAVRQDPKRPKQWWEIVEPVRQIRIVGVKKWGG
jgi:hypothetical protein